MPEPASTFGPLKCRLVNHRDASTAPRRMAVLCHGFGAPANDLEPLGEEMTDAFPDLADVAFVFPEGPVALDQYGIPGGRAWWMLNRRIFQDFEDYGEVRDRSLLNPPELPEVRETLRECIDAALAHFRLDMDHCILGGFSQGAMAATDLALRGPESPAGLCVWSGTYLYQQEWAAAAKDRLDLSVFQSHGYHDPLLPFALAKQMHDAFVKVGVDVEFYPFTGEHQIPAEALAGLARVLRRI